MRLMKQEQENAVLGKQLSILNTKLEKMETVAPEAWAGRRGICLHRWQPLGFLANYAIGGGGNEPSRAEDRHGDRI